ncbi:hypothetical protein C0993_004388 [Termitomyces sp. T159_Od127]|nr:hypothetical protein C0993_004388 [Termitomyces sp. T159_Od127]
MSALSIALSDGACLIDSTGSEPDLKTVLLKRLSNYYARLGNECCRVRETSLEDIQLLTAREALAVVTRVQEIIGIEEQPGVDQPPLIGTRDLRELRTLLSIVFRWGIEPLYARVVLITLRFLLSRLASTSSGKYPSRNQNEESAQDIYQKALKLLQDPILPVRAHGLLLLRQLVTPSVPTSNDPKLNDDALVPAIMSIFLQSIQDDDSYVFLNAVQGLVAMVDRFGKEVLKALVKEYTDGLDGLKASILTQRDLDTRTRVGEALASVIKKCGEALSLYVDIIVPPLLQLLRSRHSPTVLRASSLSLLSDCESTSPLSMLPYVTDLAGAMLDILQLEIVPTHSISGDSEKQPPSLDTEPLSTNTKFPPLRRGALHFLALMMRETTKLIYESSFGTSLFSDDFLRRAKTTLGYVASVDSDNVVRVMAREAAEDLNQLYKAILGL